MECIKRGFLGSASGVTQPSSIPSGGRAGFDILISSDTIEDDTERYEFGIQWNDDDFDQHTIRITGEQAGANDNDNDNDNDNNGNRESRITITTSLGEPQSDPRNDPKYDSIDWQDDDPSKNLSMEEMDEILEEREEDILDSGKERKNSKSYKLTVKSNNLLLIIPRDLDEKFEQFKAFIDKVNLLYKTEKSNNQIDSSTSKKDKEDRITQMDFLSLLQYDIIEIINDVYLFYFVVILPNKLYNEDLVHRLYSVYFEKVRQMYSYITSYLFTENQSFDSDTVQQFKLYKNYIASKEQNLMGRLYEVVDISEKNNIQDDLDILLRLLWTKNKSSSILLYKLTETSDEILLLKSNDRNLVLNANYDFNKLLEKFIHDFKINKNMFLKRSNKLQSSKGFL